MLLHSSHCQRALQRMLCCVHSLFSWCLLFYLIFLSIGPFLLLFRQATAKGSRERRELRLSSKTVYLKSIYITAHLKAVIK